jgi:hypothetical protein
MALEIDATVLPSNYILVFDEISRLGENDHKEAFCLAVRKFITCVESLTGGDAEIFIPGSFIRQSDGNVWVGISSLLLNVEYFSTSLYFREDFEFSTKFRYMGHPYRIYFNGDPVLFGLESVVRKSGRKAWWKAWFGNSKRSSDK